MGTFNKISNKGLLFTLTIKFGIQEPCVIVSGYNQSLIAKYNQMTMIEFRAMKTQ